LHIKLFCYLFVPCPPIFPTAPKMKKNQRPMAL
jgi:hypothetical protein